MSQEPTPRAEVVWRGDSREVVRGFPRDIQRELGKDLQRVQLSVSPKNAKAMRSIGRKVGELRQKGKTGYYRTIYFGILEGKVYVLHAFIKKSAKTPRTDLDIAQKRLKQLLSELKLEKKRGMSL